MRKERRGATALLAAGCLSLYLAGSCSLIINDDDDDQPTTTTTTLAANANFGARVGLGCEAAGLTRKTS